MAIVNPISLATKGVLGPGGTIDPLGLATIGVLTIESAGVPSVLAGVRRTQLLTMMSRYRR